MNESFVCQKHCYGHHGNHGGCCTIADRDFIMGPVSDTERVLIDLHKRMPGVLIGYSDVFIDYEEGHKLFPDKLAWQNPDAYPAMRPDVKHPSLSCLFYNNTLGVCGIYDIRPNMCREFKCDYLKGLK